MAIGANLALQQKQDVRLTAELREAIELLQFSALDVQQLINQELADNPCLEAETENLGDGMADGRDEADWHQEDNHRSGEGDIADIGSNGPAAVSGPHGEGEGGWEATATRAITLQEHLARQFDAIVPAGVLRVVGHYLIDALDEAGYLRADLAEAAMKLNVSEDMVDDARAILQTLEPAGIGARTVAECLRLQLHAMNMLDIPTETCLNHLDKVAAWDWPWLAKAAHCDEELINDAVASIRACNPKPGLNFTLPRIDAVLPDIVVEAENGGWKVALNGAAFPRLLVNPLPLPLGKNAVAQAGRAWARERTQRARWLVGALEQRAQTILLVARAIVAKQNMFFEAGAEFLIPLSLRDIAREVGVHESTVSRVTTGTFMQTPRGVFPFRAFVASGVASIGGQVGVAAHSVQAMIKRFVEGESPTAPLSDEQLVKLLNAEGVQVARRTVAKYREAASIPGSSQRRVRRAP